MAAIGSGDQDSVRMFEHVLDTIARGATASEVARAGYGDMVMQTTTGNGGAAQNGQVPRCM